MESKTIALPVSTRNPPLYAYLASRFDYGPQLKTWRANLGKLHCNVTSTWFEEQPHKADEQLTQAQKRPFADRDLRQIRQADFFIQWNLREHYENDRTCGRHIEFGFAVAMGKLIILIGESRSVFHSYADVIVTEDAAKPEVLVEIMRVLRARHK